MATHTWNIMEAWQASFAIGGQRARSNYQSSLQASVSSTDGQADMHAYVGLLTSPRTHRYIPCCLCPQSWTVADLVPVLAIQAAFGEHRGHIIAPTCGLAWANLYRSPSGIDPLPPPTHIPLTVESCRWSIALLDIASLVLWLNNLPSVRYRGNGGAPTSAN
jgi:hypothetical protein